MIQALVVALFPVGPALLWGLLRREPLARHLPVEPEPLEARFGFDASGLT